MVAGRDLTLADADFLDDLMDEHFLGCSADHGGCTCDVDNRNRKLEDLADRIETALSAVGALPTHAVTPEDE